MALYLTKASFQKRLGTIKGDCSIDCGKKVVKNQR